MKNLVDKLKEEKTLSSREFLTLLENRNDETDDYIAGLARQTANEHYGNKILVRGLIEFTNYCKNNCYYCGIRCSNKNADRYRLDEEQILECCQNGYDLGFRTFVLQGGEDPVFTDEKILSLVKKIKTEYPDCALTLSVGERDKSAYEAWFSAGADRFLLRHETADSEHYSLLHPDNLSLENRIKCLETLKKIGYQTGCGFMVGSPNQSYEHIVKDLEFIRDFKPQMVGIGPFIPHKDTPFKDHAAGSAELTIFLLSVIRLMLPNVLLPATTALQTLLPDGRKRGFLAGANVCMPNLSPMGVREKYSLYDNKAFSGNESAQSLLSLKKEAEEIGFEVVVDRGDFKE